MIAARNIRSLLGIGLLLVGTLQGATPTHLLPGVTYYDGPEKLTGKLVFLVGSKPLSSPQQEMSATLYEFDLQKRVLRRMTMAPGGAWLVPSKDGTLVGLVFQSDSSFPTTATMW